MFIDSHCHLTHLDLKKYDGQLDGVIHAARAAGVHNMLCVSVDISNAEAVTQLAREYEDVYAAVGIHPLDCQPGDQNLARLEELLGEPKVVALGEIGLDYHYSPDNKSLQKSVFAEQLELAKEQEKPVIVHTREARKDTLELIRIHGCRQSAGVLHCFTESWEMAKAAMDMNYCISFSGIVTFKNAEDIRDVVRKMPLDRLLIETDSPYLAPVPFRGKPNEPAYVVEVGRFIAELKGVTVDQLSTQVEMNFNRLFKLFYNN
ncbi:putative metal-dependent hydrolase YcfH [invertebrate metagenome]|uniref:Putative metal-dependent hydrolase YcfH n=1 Tax=invertebrate metagenome TaxID=1711999 RepID=A0A2H9T9P1_9ZZZZ